MKTERRHVCLGSPGFTLVEMAVILVIVALLATLAVPGFQTLISSNRQQSASSSLLVALNQARGEALKRLRTIAACKSTDGTACSTAAGVNWEDGYITFVNTDADNPPVLDAGEEVLAVHGSPGDNISIRLSDSASTDFLLYLPDGRSSSAASFTICDDRGASQAKSVIVSSSGRAKSATTRVGGEALVCP